jgi:ATP-dependent helicase HrpB
MDAILPIDEVLPQVIAALREHGRAVLEAPPGAGKTTRVPLALLNSGVSGRIVMLEPRRLAARAAAERMSQTLGEKLGHTVGYRVRGESVVSKITQIEVVTEGILTRMIQSDPSLDGITALIFDEFHERSLNADLGLALAWEIRGALRPDLQILVMSATLDAAPIAAMLDNAPRITSQGKLFPVETRWLERPLAKDVRFEIAMSDLIVQALRETTGGVLAFFPGEGEIRRVQGLLSARISKDIQVVSLFGAMPFKAQQVAIATIDGRKLVLATSIAETSLTIDGIHVVVDGGKARRARYDAASGMSRLVTEQATKAEAEQRRGRAGRVSPGLCYRLWTKGEEGGMAPYPIPEIAVADLTGLALELALWGSDLGLAFLTPPNLGAIAQAKALLIGLGALDVNGRITPHGRDLAAFPLHPRLAHMLVIAGKSAAPLAALLADRDPLRGAGVDLKLRLDILANPSGSNLTFDRSGVERIKAEAPRLARLAPERPAMPAAEAAALAYPDRIGLRRKGSDPRFILSGGKGAVIDASDPLANAMLIVATDLDGDLREAKVRQAILLSERELRSVHAKDIHWQKRCDWSRRDGRVQARLQEMFGALVLDDRPWLDVPSGRVALAMLDGVREIGLPLNDADRRLQSRVQFLRHEGSDLPDFSDQGLLESANTWLLPHLESVKTSEAWKAMNLSDILFGALTWQQREELDRLAPAHYTTPMDRNVPIDYSRDAPEISVRLQEMFGVTLHPSIGPKRLPLRVTLVSPAQKPLQTTMDLPGFWASSYADVRKDMRGRYPRHPWPEDPTVAEPTLRAKPRGT